MTVVHHASLASIVSPLLLRDRSTGALDDDEGRLQGCLPPLIEDGNYEAVYTGHETKALWGGTALKLAVYLRIESPGPHNGVDLARHYNVLEINGKPRTNGGFVAGPRSHYIREFLQVVPDWKDGESLSPQAFLGQILRVRVRAVRKDWSRETLPKTLHYSVVDRILGAA